MTRGGFAEEWVPEAVAAYKSAAMRYRSIDRRTRKPMMKRIVKWPAPALLGWYLMVPPIAEDKVSES
jgi:hypothetical protein